ANGFGITVTVFELAAKLNGIVSAYGNRNPPKTTWGTSSRGNQARAVDASLQRLESSIASIEPDIVVKKSINQRLRNGRPTTSVERRNAVTTALCAAPKTTA